MTATQTMRTIQSVSPLLQVKDLEASIRFYIDKLGFHEQWRDPRGFVILRRDGGMIFLAQKTRDVDLRNTTARAVKDGFANYDLFFDCEHGTIDALWREFKDKGLKMWPQFDNGPVDRPYGMRDIALADPDGYDLVFGAPIEKECDDA